MRKFPRCGHVEWGIRLAPVNAPHQRGTKGKSMTTEKNGQGAPVDRVVIQHRYMCELCGGLGQFLSCACGHCSGVGYLGYRQVTKDYFYKIVEAIDCHPRPTGKYPYTSQFTTPQGIVAGAHVGSNDSYWIQDSE